MRMLDWRRWLPAVIALLTIAPLLQAQQMIFTRSTRGVKSTPTVLASSHAVALDVNMQAFRAAAGSELHIRSMPLAPDLSVDLDLHEYTIIAPGAQLTSTGADGRPVPLPPLTARLYRGKVHGEQGSDVYLAFSSGGVMGLVTTDGKGYEIATDQSVTSVGDNRIAALCTPSRELSGNAVHCGVDESNIDMLGGMSTDEMAKHMTLAPRTMSSVGDEILYSVIGAYDADYEYLQRFGGDKQAAADYMLSTIGQVSAVYERDLSCQLVIGYMNLWDTPNDPYTESGVMQLALQESRTWWEKNRDTVTRGFTNVFSGKPWSGVIGIAYLNVLCQKVPAIGFCGITRTNPTQDTRVVAHETGHIFGSKHTHDCSWPGGAIDSCAAAEGGSCFTGSKPSLGTIMSYCSQADFKFHPKCIDLMKGILATPSMSCVILSRKLTVLPLLIRFPGVMVGNPIDTTLPGFYRNNSRDTVHVLTQKLEGKNADKFVILSQAPPFTLLPGASRDFRVKYLADDESASVATLTITHDALNPTIKAGLEAYAESNQPVLAFIAPKGEINWGQRRMGSKSDTAMPSLYTNLGLGPLHATKTEIIGPDRFEFELLEGSAPFDLEKNEKLGAKLRFAPTTAGPKLAYLRVVSNSKSTVPDTIPLRGEVYTGPRLVLKANDLAIDYRDRMKGKQYDTSFSQFFYNDGSETMTIVASLQGADARDFILNSFAFEELAPGAALDLDLTFFVPKTEEDGQKQAVLVINTFYNSEPLDTIRINLLGRVEGVSSVPTSADQAAGIRIVPNPTAGDADVKVMPLPGETGRGYTIRLTDAAGRELDLRRGVFGAQGFSYRIESNNLASGVYYITVTTSAGTRVGSVTLAR
jgi:hypothetical protein